VGVKIPGAGLAGGSASEAMAIAIAAASGCVHGGSWGGGWMVTARDRSWREDGAREVGPGFEAALGARGRA